MKLYKFYKPGCAPCNTLKAIMRTISLPEEIELVDVDITQTDSIEFEVTQVPMLIFENGNSIVGVKPKVVLEKWISSYGN